MTIQTICPLRLARKACGITTAGVYRCLRDQYGTVPGMKGPHILERWDRGECHANPAILALIAPILGRLPDTFVAEYEEWWNAGNGRTRGRNQWREAWVWKRLDAHQIARQQQQKHEEELRRPMFDDGEDGEMPLSMRIYAAGGRGKHEEVAA